MKIYYDTDRDVIVIAGLNQVFMPKSLTTVIINNQIAIRLVNDTLNIIAPQDFNKFQDQNGNTFNDILHTNTYLLGVFTTDGIPDTLDLVSLFESGL